MPSQAPALVAKLNSIGRLSDDDRQLIEALPFSVRHLEPDQDLMREGDQPTQCCILLSGWVCRHKSLPSGNRQILSLQLPGDLTDLQSLDMPVMDHSITALSSAHLACIPHPAMRQVLHQSPTLTSMLWRAVLIEAASTRQWLLNFGQSSALARIAHLMCELFVRLRAIGMAQEVGSVLTFSWPLTQMLLGQTLGMSAVHANRSLQELRGAGLIQLAQRQVTILDWTGLKAVASFDAAYLGLGWNEHKAS